MFSLLPWEFKKSIEVHPNTERSDFAGGPRGRQPPGERRGGSGQPPPPPRLGGTFFENSLLMKIVAVAAFGAFPLRIAVIFQADADFEVKSAVDSYFSAVFWTFFGSKFWSKFSVFFFSS